jgi:hypothetical protein
LTLEGKSANTASLIELNSASLELNDHAVIKGNVNTGSKSGGGVYITGGTFDMYGGSIESNSAGTGGGVHVDDADFNMRGGTIKGNTATTAGGGNGRGGGVYVQGTWAHFTMTGGVIYGTDDAVNENTATTNGDSIYVNTGNANYGLPYSGIYNSPIVAPGTGDSLTLPH